MAKLFALSCFLLLFLSCSNNQNTFSSVRAYSDSDESSNNANSPQDPTGDRVIVPPEIAITNATIDARASSFDETTNLLATNSSKLINSVNKIEGCSINIIDYHHPVGYGSRKIDSLDAQKYSSSMQLEILIDFASAKDIQSRIKQLNKCLRGIPKLKVEKDREDKNKSVYLSLSQVMPTVKDLGKYRQQLLTAKFKPLKTVASIAEPAGQFKALDTQCTSKGVVTVRDRSLSAIELDIDFDCRRLINKQVINNK